MQIINNLPMEYNSLVEAVEEDMNKELEYQVTVKRVRKRIRSKFRRITVRMDKGNSSNSNKNEVVLVIPLKQFKRLCALCGKQGQK